MIRFIFLASIFSLARSCPDEYNCRLCVAFESEQPVCKFCENSFLTADEKSCETAIPSPVANCMSYSDQTVCSVCRWGFYLDESDNSCYQCTVNDCAICTKDQKCTMCFKGLFRDKISNSCVSKEEPLIENCDIVDTSSFIKSCMLCMPGFASDLLMTSCEPGPDNCQQMLSDGEDQLCMFCRSGYYMGGDTLCYLNGSWSRPMKKVIMIMIAIALVFLLVIGLIIYCIVRFCCGCRKMPTAGTDGEYLAA